MTVNAPFGNATVTIEGNPVTGQISYTQDSQDYSPKVPSTDSALLTVTLEGNPKNVQLTPTNANASNYPVFVEIEENIFSIKMATNDLPDTGNGMSWFYFVQY